MSAPLRPPTATGARDGDLPAYVGNGLIGLRVREVPLVAGLMIVSGVAGTHPERRVEAAAPCPYPLAGDVAIDGVWLSDQPWSVSALSQDYDFETAELTSRFAYVVGSRRATIEVVTLASRTAPSIVLQRVSVEVDGPCRLGLRARIDIEGLRGRLTERRTETPGEPDPVCDGEMLWEPEGALSRCGLALATDLRGAEARRTSRSWDRLGPLVTDYDVELKGRHSTVVLTQLAAVVPSAAHAHPHEEARRRVARATRTGFEVLRTRNRDAWRELWRGRIQVRGLSPERQALIDAATFYLLASTHRGSVAATSIFGLATWTDYHYYYGHVMWDLDAFCVPPLLLLQPDAARAFLEFRYEGLSAARRTAQLSDRLGLQFPWETGPASHDEAAPGDGSAAAHEDHGSLHVARAFGLYADATGDAAFLKERAWPVLRGVADWIVSRASRTARGVEILRANGPAEVPDPPDNDAFTAMAAKSVLRRALRCADQLGVAAPEAWAEVEAALVLPIRADGVIGSHDGFRIDEPKGATPSPLAGLFPYDHPSPPDERRKTLEFFLARWKDYVGSPMLPALYPVWATMAGDRALAAKLFDEAYGAYDQGRFHQCLEYRPDHPDSEVRAGPFFANLGGMLMGLVFGLTGLRVDDGDPARWSDGPIVLPQGWEAVEIERVWVRGRPMRLKAVHGAKQAELTPILGDDQAADSRAGSAHPLTG